MKLKCIGFIFAAAVQIGCSSSSQKSESKSTQVHAVEKPKPVVTKEPTSRETEDALSSALKSQNSETLFKAATQRLSTNPKDPRALIALAQYHYSKSQFGASEYFLTLAEGVRSNAPEIHNNLGLIHLRRGDETKAIRSFRKAIELDSRYAPAAAQLGSIYLKHKDYARAQPALEIAYREYRKNPSIVTNYGSVLLATGQFQKADKVFREALKLDDGNKEAVFNLAILLVEFQNKNQEGLDFINRLKFLGPLPEMRNKIVVLENKAKLALNQ